MACDLCDTDAASDVPRFGSRNVVPIRVAIEVVFIAVGIDIETISNKSDQQ